jgi:hypothetical protein
VRLQATEAVCTFGGGQKRNDPSPLSYHQFQQRLRCCRWLIDQAYLLLLLLSTMANTATSVTTFRRRLKAAVIVILAAALLPLEYAATFTGVYALVEVTLFALVRPRSWPLRLLGTAMVVALYLLLQKHVSYWAGFLPPIVYVVLVGMEYIYTRAAGRWRSGTDLVIARAVLRGPGPRNTSQTCMWNVYSHEDIDDTQMQIIERKFCGDCPAPRFQQPWNHQPVVDICLRSVQFWYSEEEGRHLQRVSEWCAPRRHQPAEFEYRATPLQRLDQLASAFYAFTCLGLAYTIFFVEWIMMQDWENPSHEEIDKHAVIIVMSGVFYVFFCCHGTKVDPVLDWLIDLACRCSSKAWSSASRAFKAGVRRTKTAAKWTRAFFSRTCKSTYNAGRTIANGTSKAWNAGARGTKTATKWTRACFVWTCKNTYNALRTIANGTSKAWNWMRPCASMTCAAFVRVGHAVARGVDIGVDVAVEVTTVVVLLAMAAMVAKITFLVILWLWEVVSEVSSSTGAFLLRLWDVVSAAALLRWRGISLQAFVRAAEAAAGRAAQASAVVWEVFGALVACSWRLALLAGAIGVAAGVARAFVLTVKAACDGCSCLLASGYKERTLLRKSRCAGGSCRRRKLSSVHGEKAKHASPSALVAAAWRDVVRLDAGEQQPKAKRGKAESCRGPRGNHAFVLGAAGDGERRKLGLRREGEASSFEVATRRTAADFARGRCCVLCQLAAPLATNPVVKSARSL